MRVLLVLGFLCAVHLASAQFVTRGKVIGSDDQLPLPQVTVMIKGTEIGTLTDKNGEFTLTVPDKDVKITLRYLAYITKTVKPDFDKPMLIQLSPDCTHHHYLHAGVKIYGGFDLTNNAVAGRVEFPSISFYKETSLSYELSGWGGQETHRADIKMWDVIFNCRWQMHSAVGYRNYQISKSGFDFNSITFSPQLELNTYELILGIGRGVQSIREESLKTTGYQLGIGKSLYVKLWGWWEIPFRVTATRWNTFWEFETSVNLFIWPAGFRLSYNHINGFDQFTLIVGIGI